MGAKKAKGRRGGIARFKKHSRRFKDIIQNGKIWGVYRGRKISR